MYKKIIARFILLYIILSAIVLSFFYINYKLTTSSYLKKKSNEQFLNYQAIYNEHKILSNLVFNTDINTPEIINLFKKAYKANKNEKESIRTKLHSILATKYEKLKSYKLKQLHFHLPNNESFLRMHRPNKYGDNLTNIRQTVKYVNENKKFIDGFEEGRIFNGFRFVYPLFDKNNLHIGSVEISFGALALIDSIVETFDVDSQFVIKKDIVNKKVFKEERKNYIKSPFKNYYYEKSIYKKYPLVDNTKTPKDFDKKISKGKAFSIYIKDLEYTKTFIPIKNTVSKEVVAILCICQRDKFMENDRRSFYLMSFFSIIAIALIVFLFFKQKISNEKLKNINTKLDRRIALELRRSRRKDLSILSHSKMASIAEMLNNIAHQWRQPLSVISTSASGLILHKESSSLDDKNFKFLTKAILENTQYLSKTIDSFREYVEDHSDETKNFELQDKVDKAMTILENTYKSNNIKIIKSYTPEKLYITGNVGEFIQIILNILNNAKDALIKNEQIIERKVTIKIRRKTARRFALITIEDNAGGVPSNIIEKIFDPYFTTKHKSIGTGISLYMCYEIITNNFKGDIYLKNKDDGAKFYIEVPLSSNHF